MDSVFTFIESAAFERICAVYLDDDQYGELQKFMMENPEAGQIIPGSGGVRKLRWKRKDRKSTRLNSSHIQKSRMPSSA